MLFFVAAMCVTAGKAFSTLGFLAIFTVVSCGILWARLEWLRRAEESKRNPDYERDHRAHVFHRNLRQQALHKAKQDLAQPHIQQANSQLERFGREFSYKKEQLKALRCQYDQLRSEYDAELAGLRKHSEASQRRAFLERHLIADAKIPQIGPTRIAVLRAFGVETAADVEEKKIRRIKGFDRVYPGKLVAWRGKLERSFRMDATAPLPETELLALGVKYRQLQQALEVELQKGPVILRDITAKANQQLAPVIGEVQGIRKRTAQAEADFTVFSP